MTEVERLADQLDRAFNGPAWHGPALMEALKDVTARQAAQRPFPNAHTIWELVLHMTTWKSVPRWRLEGNETVPTDEQNFPAVSDTSDEAWTRALEDMIAAHVRLRESVLAMSAARLDEQLPAGGGISHFVRINGAIHHDLYHAGQIAILKKHLTEDAK